MQHNHFSIRRSLVTVIVLSNLFLLSSCHSDPSGKQILFADFFKDNIDAAPAQAQNIGTVWTPNGGVKIVGSPAPALPQNKWAMISHIVSPSAATTLIGNISQSFPSGRYGILASLYIPGTSGTVRVQLQSVSAVGFFHMDLLRDGDIIINDDVTTRFGEVAHNKTLALSMSLSITASAMTLDISITGDGRTDHKLVTIPESSRTAVEHFLSVKFGVMDEQHAEFYVDDIMVNHFAQ